MMRLLRCHVENFGTLSNFDFSFDEDMCVVKEDNGFGKTTFASFIKAMFYGMPITRKQELDENERKKYEPWQGGVFGGSLDFSCQKGEYRIERYFGAKQKDDSFNLYDLRLSKKSSDFSENIGVELFGMGADGFMRSIFMPQAETETSATSDITAKLTRLVENSDDISNYDAAMKALKQQQLTGGVKGLLNKTEREIVALEIERKECSASAEEITALQKREQELALKRVEQSRLLDNLRENIRKASEAEAAKQRAEHHREMVAQLENNRHKIKEIENKYQNGIPTEEELAEVERAVGELSNLEAKISVLEAQSFSSAELESAEAFFKGNIPCEADIDRCREDLRKADKAEAEALEILPDQSVTAGINPLGIVLMLLGIVSIVLAVMLIASKVLWTILLAVFGLLLSFFGAVLLKKGKKSATNNQTLIGEKNRKKYLNEAAEYRSRVQDFVGRYVEGDAREVLETVSAKLKVYNALKKSVEEIALKLEAEKKLKSQKTKEVDEFFEKFLGEINEEPSAVISQLRKDAVSFETASNAAKELQRKIAQVPEASREFEQKLEVEPLVAQEKLVSSFLGRIADEIASLKARIAVAEPKVSRLGDVISAIEEKAELCELYRKQLKAVEIASELLTVARDNLSESYMQPMKHSFEKYVVEISGENIGQYLLDTDFNLMISRVGKSWEKDYFSSGVKDMLDICMRLALIDALYDGEKPVLILDDPFVNLDDDRLSQALKLLKKISKDRQILYLTCHSARIPK